MNIRKITQSILFFIFSLYALQVEAGIILDLGTAEAPAGGSANVSLEIRSDGGTHQIEGGSVIINYDASILVPNLDSIATPLGSSWSVTAGPAPSGPPGSSISTDSFQLTFFPAVTGSPIPVIASSQEIAIIPVTVSANRAVKRAEMLFDPETFNVEVGLSAGEQEQHVFATFDNGGVTVTDWTAVYQNATDTLSEDTLAGNLYFQIYKDGGEKYARYWLFKGENASGVKEGWYKEYRGRDSGTNLFNIRAKYFNWSVDNSLLNLTGAITESGITDSSWTRIFAALPGATSHQLALYGGVTVDGSNTPLLRKIDRNFTVQAVGDLPYILKFNDEDRPEWSEVVLLSSDGTARSGSSDGEKGSFSWRIGTGAESAIKRGALIISGTSLVGETFEEEVYVLADSEEGELLTVSITDEGFEQKRVEVLVSEGFSAVTDLKNQTWQYTDASGDNDDEISFFDISSTSTLLVNGIAETGFSGEEKEGYVKVPFSWAVDTSGTLFMESLAYGNERIIKVNSGKGYMEIVFLDDPEGVEQLISGFSRFDTFDASDGATLWLSRETSGDDGTKRLTLNVGGLGDKKISDLAVSFGYDCLPGRLVKVGVINVTPSTQDCADGYTHQVMHSFDATGTGDGLLLDLDFQVDGNFLRVDLNSADATDSLGNKIDFVRLEGSDIVGKSLILVAEIDVYNKNSGQIETVTIAAPQSWFDPTTNQLKLPSSHVELNELLGNLADRDYETVSLVSGTSDAGAGFNIRFAIYEDVNGDFFIDPADGDTFSSSLTTELVRVNDGYNDPYKNDFVEEGWYIVDRFGNMDQLNDGDVVDAVTGVDTVGGVAVEYGQIVMLDVMEFSSNGEGGPRNQPVVLEGAVFDSQTNAVILPSMIQLEDFWTALQYQDATIQISNDASGTVNETILPPPEAG
ncbi:MAG: hypothetical protein HOG80_09170, partial [Candidatus Marinimicrobia bacterium]|nr:hypothetical protein [Candidatus Neomarinimicrobiota bacterium]